MLKEVGPPPTTILQMVSVILGHSNHTVQLVVVGHYIE